MVRSMTSPQITPGPRQDVVVSDPETGEPRRLTGYTGTVWLAPPPQVDEVGGRFRVVSSPGVEPMDPSRPLQLFLPDSHPYRGAEGVVSCSGAPLGGVDQVGADARLLYPLVAQLSPDPRGGDRAWVMIEVRGRGRLHALTYTVWVTVAPDRLE
jgi:hypothetical protein